VALELRKAEVRLTNRDFQTLTEAQIPEDRRIDERHFSRYLKLWRKQSDELGPLLSHVLPGKHGRPGAEYYESLNRLPKQFKQILRHVSPPPKKTRQR
jgi:hypothetical protein